MHILSMLDHKSRLNCIYWYAIYLVICVRIDCTHSRSRVTYFTGCDTTSPGGGGGRPGVGLSPMLLYQCWASVGPAGVAAWAVTGSWPGAVCELFSPFEHAKYQYLCNKANLRDLIAATGLVIANWIQIVNFSARVTVKFDGWPQKTLGHFFYTTLSFVHHFKSIEEFKLDLQSRNAQFGWKLVICYHVWLWNLMDDLRKE